MAAAVCNGCNHPVDPLSDDYCPYCHLFLMGNDLMAGLIFAPMSPANGIRTRWRRVPDLLPSRLFLNRKEAK